MSSAFSIKNELASRYSLALLELALERKQMDAVCQDLHSLTKICAESKEFVFMLNCPTIPVREKCAVLAAIADKAGFSKTVTDFLETVATNNRLFALSAMIDSFFALLAKKNGVVNVSVTSATALDNAGREELTATLTNALGKDIELTLKVDAKLLGGLMIKVGSILIDSSLRSRVQQLKTVMKGA